MGEKRGKTEKVPIFNKVVTIFLIQKVRIAISAEIPIFNHGFKEMMWREHLAEYI